MANFVKQTFASLVGSLLGLFIFFGIGTTGLLLLLLAATFSREPEPVVKDKSFLVFDLSTKITEGEPKSSQFFQQVISGNYQKQISLRALVDTVEKAKNDKRIIGIYLDASKATQGEAEGFATLREIRRSLEKFRDSGKKIVAYGTNWGEKGYYLSSVADTVAINPLGGMEINGFSSQPMFLAGAFEKYGVGVQIVRVGKFKGAVEPFVLKKLSPENRTQLQVLLNDLWSEWRTTVGKTRKITPQQLQQIADNQAVLLADRAKANGLVDKVAYADEVIADLKKLTGSKKQDESFRQISLAQYTKTRDTSSPTKRRSKNKVAVVYAEGAIVDGEGENEQIGGDRFAKIFRNIRQDKNIKAVVLRINSPGGSATASEVMQREIRLTQKLKPVVVSMGDVAASGGYWIAVDSNRIFAEPNTVTGSIGVFGSIFNIQELANDNGITWDSVKTGRYADSQGVSRPKSPQELAIYQRIVNSIYDVFLNKVAKGRNLPKAKVAEIAQGRVWSGSRAKQIGLVDEIGGLDKAIAHSAKLAKLGNNWQLKEYPRLSSFEERFFGIAKEEVSAIITQQKSQELLSHPLGGELRKLKEEIEIFENMKDPRGVYARLPFNFRIE
ncbi:signal peptide peptidase SppA [Mastigocoleus testarum]|uniref:Protease 4 n=1 Tax=Mastigocoleus testarum BC008 TaxID=371196 RepID=A0A0V7ZD21_9CYAN|nr:signal peptide peptidase SppA [Mastigocoleus testarum]KST62441.1 signal peptide peptidase SppA [Mastigocoleus testarum BC008]